MNLVHFFNSFYKVNNQLVWFDKVQKFGKCIINAQHIELKQREKSQWKFWLGKEKIFHDLFSRILVEYLASEM